MTDYLHIDDLRDDLDPHTLAALHRHLGLETVVEAGELDDLLGLIELERRADHADQ